MIDGRAVLAVKPLPGPHPRRKDALGHVVVALRNSARIGSCIWKVAP